MTRVKICGLSEEEHALVAAEAGADYLGFVFAPSPRQVPPEKASQIISAVSRLNKPPLTVGVFVNAVPAEVNRTAEYCRLDLAQLSGDENLEYCHKINRPVIKTVHVSPEDTPEKIYRELDRYRNEFGDGITFMLDTHSKLIYGGTGSLFNWDVAGKLPADWPVIMAGGLTPANVIGLVQKYRPWGVDVSGGVETNGKKDSRKIRAFIEITKTVIR